MSFQKHEPDEPSGTTTPFDVVLVLGLCVLAGLTIGSLCAMVWG